MGFMEMEGGKGGGRVAAVSSSIRFNGITTGLPRVLRSSFGF